MDSVDIYYVTQKISTLSEEDTHFIFMLLYTLHKSKFSLGLQMTICVSWGSLCDHAEIAMQVVIP